MKFTESHVEQAALARLESMGYPPDKQEQATQTVLEQAGEKEGQSPISAHDCVERHSASHAVLPPAEHAARFQDTHFRVNFLWFNAQSRRYMLMRF